MQISTSSPVGSVCLHPALGAGVLRVNAKVQAFGTDIRLIEVEFAGAKGVWTYLSETEEYLDILGPSSCPIGAA
jgi:hypothetical protein